MLSRETSFEEMNLEMLPKKCYGFVKFFFWFLTWRGCEF